MTSEEIKETVEEINSLATSAVSELEAIRRIILAGDNYQGTGELCKISYHLGLAHGYADRLVDATSMLEDKLS